MHVRIGTNDTGWGGPIRRRVPALNDEGWVERFLDDAASAGFEGVELSPGMLGDFGDNVVTLNHSLSHRGLTLAGAVIVGHLERRSAWPVLEKQVRRAAEALASSGARHLVLIDMLFVDGAPPPLTERKWENLIATTNRLADLAARLGLILAVHPHVDSHLETEAQIDRFLTETDPRSVTLCLDVGQLAYLDIDPVAFVRNNHERISYLHLKNINRVVRERHRYNRIPWLQAVQDGVSHNLTDGAVDFGALRDVLNDVDYTGWAIAELDRAPVDGSESFQAAKKARDFLRDESIG